MNLRLSQGKDGGRDSQGVWDGHGHTAVFHMENQQGPAGQHRELCSVSRGSLDGRGVWGRTDTCICMAESISCSLETITTLLIGFMPKTESFFLKSCSFAIMYACLCFLELELFFE